MESDEPPIEHQCPICRSEYVEPKITPCGHSFCKRCLQSYVEDCISREGQTLSNVVCPLCRQLLYRPVACPSCRQLLPIPDGVDSLPTNRSTVDIINAHRRTACPCRRNLEKRECDICLGSSASLACEAQECASDGLRFCETCARDHVGECGHKAIGLCESHGKPLRHFCTSSGCNVPICVTCRKVEHSGHDVRLHRDVIAKEVQYLESELEAGRQKVTQLDEQTFLLCSRVEKSTSCVEELNSNLTKGIDHAIEKNKQVIREREAEIQLRVEQIRENTDQNQRLSVIRESLPRRLEAEHNNKLTDIESSVSEIEFVREQVTAVLQRGEDLITDGVPITSSLLDDIRRTSEHLLNQLMTSQRDWATPLLESKNFDVEGVTELVQDLAVGADADRGNVQRERIITMADAGLEYFATDHNVTPVKTYESSRLEIPDSDCQCDVDKTQACLVEVKSVVLMSKDRLAVCCVTACGVKKKRQNIWLWDSYMYTPLATKPKLMMSINAKTVEYQYMTKRGENELILLRRMNPVISILDIDLRATRKLNVNMPKDAIDGLWQVDVDNDGHFLLSFFTNSDHKIALVDNDGNLLSEVCCQNCEQLAFSQLTREVITCSFYDDMISVYGVHGKGISKRLSYNGSSPHDIFTDSPPDPAKEIEGLICTDICVGSLGDIFVVGRIRGDPELKGVYMIILSDDSSREVERWEELYQMRSQSDPRCSVYNNRLVISDGHKIRLLYLR